MKRAKQVKFNTSYGVFEANVFGNGENVLIAFHGFGQNASAYSPLVNIISNYTLITFDLPYHGNTKIKGNKRSMEVVDVLELFNQILDQFPAERFSIIAFSIGARLVYPILQNLDDRLEFVHLVAPDGLASNFWFNLTMGNALSRSIFLKTMQSQSVYQGIIQTSSRLKLIKRSLANFALKSAPDYEERIRVYDTWNALRNLYMKRKVLEETDAIHNIKITIFIGRRDLVVNRKTLQPILHVFGEKQIVELPSNHTNLLSAYFEHVRTESEY